MPGKTHVSIGMYKTLAGSFGHVLWDFVKGEVWLGQTRESADLGRALTYRKAVVLVAKWIRSPAAERHYIISFTSVDGKKITAGY